MTRNFSTLNIFYLFLIRCCHLAMNFAITLLQHFRMILSFFNQLLRKNFLRSCIFYADFGDLGQKKQLFLRFFAEILEGAKRVYKILSFSTAPSVLRKNVKKVSKKVLTLQGLRGIIYKSTRYGNKTKAKIVRQNESTKRNCSDSRQH